MKKAAILIIVLVLLSSFSLAQNKEDYCEGFWGKVKCVLFGDLDEIEGRVLVGVENG